MLDISPDWPTALIDFPAPESGADAHRNPRRRLHFRQPRQWLVAWDASQVPGLLQQVSTLSTQGLWCVGWVQYEAAPAFDPHLPVKATAPGAPFAVWAVFDEAHDDWPTLPEPAESASRWQVQPLTPDRSTDQQRDNIERIHQLIRDGEVYQINLTGQWRGELVDGHQPGLHAYFRALHQSQPGGYACFLDARQATRSPGAVLSVSPELFFDWDGQRIVTRPMKGTAPRHADPQADQASARHLTDSVKERAENLMIVDLLRNDLSRVAETGSVRVESLFDVQAWPTVWQMTSTIAARTRQGIDLPELFSALFPCGSVTGAPKRQAMHHIARLEASPRGVYCGTLGVLAPGGHATFSVAIRTLCVDTPPPPAPWRAHVGIGSGITLDAQADGELQEWQHKLAFVRRTAEPFSLLESMRLEDGQLARLPLHLARLEQAARHFGVAHEHWAWAKPWSTLEQGILQQLSHTRQSHPQGLFKVRLLLSLAGDIRIDVQAVSGPTASASPPRADALLADDLPWVALAHTPMPPADEFIAHKTTRRAAYDAHRPPAGCLDTLLFNEQHELTEFTIGNVALKLDGTWYTPPESVGLLPGVMRAQLLSGQHLQERRLTLGDLRHAEALALLNSVRGWLPVRLQPPR